ncbi:MAG: hypothetical protein RIA69_01820 [Cyclobacteriaceae bacterium]
MESKNRLVYFFRETAIVVIGVLIAVSLNNLKEKIDNDNYIKKTLSAIENEITLSQSQVDTVLNRHLEMIDNLEDVIGDNEQKLGEMIGSLGGFQQASVKNVSLRFFISNKAELVEFQLIAQLLEIEAHTDVLSDKIKRLAGFAIENINDKDEETKMTFTYLLLDVIDSEQALLQAYSYFLEENEDNLKTGSK